MNDSFIDCDSQVAYDHFMQLFETNSFRFAELQPSYISGFEGHVEPLS